MGQLNPTREEILDAHNALTSLLKLASGTSTASAIFAEKIVRAALPPIPCVTLNDIFWDVNELLFAEVEHIESGEPGMLLAYDVMPDGEKFIYVNHFDGKIHRYSPKLLALTGEKYTLEKETPND